ncbi:MATE family efflux transporter [Nitratireductor pacificus]|uniref:DNA-damage-inducible protein n=1 Tax=Nitratireductor pacificus pht-3B TaxID=391937 RepID=K2M6B3_9HYPH|nr:MATE family efflux transporter [Nitratireductor pacificus]EKF17661.1 DNA-damage-inducible protein [Nitratireductor pacificus pht-3B]
MDEAVKPLDVVRPFEVTNRLVLSIAVPMTLAYLTTPLLGIVDTAVIGQFGDAALLGGLAAGAIVFDVVFTTFNFLRSGTTGLVAQAFGRDDVLEEQAVLWRALALGIVSGLIVILIGPLISAAGVWFIDPEPRVAEAMTAYVAIRILAAPLSLMNYAILGYVLGRGEGGLGLALQFILNGGNIAFSILLGLHLGWGLEGVAWGTVIGEALGALAGLAILAYRLRKGPRVSWTRVADMAAIMRMIAMNRDIMIRSFSLLAAFALFTRQGAQFGTVTLAANAVLMNFFLVAGYFLDGMATAAEQLAGRAIGARFAPAFHRSVRLTGIWGFGLAIPITVLLLLFGTDFIAFIVTNESVREVAGAFLPWAALIAISGVLAFQMDGVFIGATWSRDMRNMMLLSFIVYLVCMVVLTRYFGNHGLWAALHVFLLVRGLSLAAILPRRARQVFAG